MVRHAVLAASCVALAAWGCASNTRPGSVVRSDVPGADTTTPDAPSPPDAPFGNDDAVDAASGDALSDALSDAPPDAAIEASDANDAAPVDAPVIPSDPLLYTGETVAIEVRGLDGSVLYRNPSAASCTASSARLYPINYAATFPEFTVAGMIASMMSSSTSTVHPNDAMGDTVPPTGVQVSSTPYMAGGTFHVNLRVTVRNGYFGRLSGTSVDVVVVGCELQ